ncbi:MAG: hypothetical protein HZC24_12955 [Rhodocyclales bacterium]|nr:hypothetical protein [Rhodocyclales bacterium]
MSAGADLTPIFKTAAECRDWLSRAPVTDIAHAHALLLGQINLLNRYALPVGERLDIFELLRNPIHETQEELSRKYAGKPLPLTAAEQAAFDACQSLWQGLATGYMRCAEACFAGDASMKSKAALVLQRALATFAAEQLEIHRSNRSPGAEHWQLLHQLYAAAEQLKVADQQVIDATRDDKLPGSPAAAYVEALLLAAANLHEHSQRQITWIARWAQIWSGKVRVLAAPPTLSTQAIPLCADLATDRPAGYMPLNTAGARWLDTSELRRSIKKRLQMLEQGEAPAKLGLGADCTQPSCEQALKLVYQRWCKGGAVRGFERRPASGKCRFVAGIEAIHYYLSERKPFKDSAAADISQLRREREEMETFGNIAMHRHEHFSEQHGYAVEQWQLQENWHMVDSSGAGMRIARPLAQQGARVGHRQLIATCAEGTQSFLLGCVRWALIADTLQVGVNLFPGQPEPVALRGSGPAAAGEKYRQAFLLPGLAALRAEPSLVMPVGTFKLGRIVEVLTAQARLLRLTRLIDRGTDFERAAYETV